MLGQTVKKWHFYHRIGQGLGHTFKNKLILSPKILFSIDMSNNEFCISREASLNFFIIPNRKLSVTYLRIAIFDIF